MARSTFCAMLSDLVERAAQGEEIVIAKNGRPRARLAPVHDRTDPRSPGALKGPDFDEDPTDTFECMQEGRRRLRALVTALLLHTHVALLWLADQP